jgi:hypothetical protein
MILTRPGLARLQGRWGSLATLFDLSGDREGWVLYLPRDRSVVRSRDAAEHAGLLLPPGELLSVLLPPGIPPRDLHDRGAAAREGDRIKLVVPPGEGGAGSAYHRVLWVHPEGRPERVEIREKTQLETPILVATYLEYEGEGAEAFPVKVRVDVEEAGQWARFEFETVSLNTEVEASQFEVRIPEGTQQLAPEDLTPDFLPEDEPGGPAPGSGTGPGGGGR